MTKDEYYANLSKANELYHHGIKGMKWGKQNGPPYPLSGVNKIKSDRARMEQLKKEYGSIEDSISYRKSDGSSGPTKSQTERMQEIEKEMQSIKDSGYDENAVKRKDTAKKVATAAVTTTALTAGAIYAVKHPQEINSLIKKVGKTTISSLKNAPNKTVNIGKNAIKSALTGFKEGVKEGVKEGPKKAGKATTIGLAMLGMKELMDISFGKETSAKIFKANNNKKIDSFWRVGQEDREE